MSEGRGVAGSKAKSNNPNGRLIEVRGLDKTFYDADREIRVLHGLDLTVQAGDEIAIVGQSGTGKSTLLHIMGSLEEPTAGKIYFEGEDLFALDQKSLAEFRNLKLGFVFQFHYLLADFTALENVMMPALISRINDAEASRRAAEMLEIVGLGNKLRRRPAELSGGEQQRVAVARAVVLRPKLLLADEPTGNLDPHTAEEVHELFHKLNRELGITLVIATHNEQLTRSVGRALRLYEGKLVDERRQGTSPAP
ncbi:MAG: ABC transporter ATP-binding protein [Candidatus Binatus sp.]|jgi:lipoprotein-releasing system ATP-binding protein|uniref:ABC transporter ATP-binding protein n=1 Tax=Candidatus Binatus sp. TaxID=2811406 RepID=UPI003D0E9A7E